jgi:hypothetical protein
MKPSLHTMCAQNPISMFAAEVIFTNSNDVPNVRAVLADADCELEIDYDAIDDESSYLFGMITGTSALPEVKIGRWLAALVANALSQGHHMDLVEWGYGEPWRPSEQGESGGTRIKAMADDMIHVHPDADYRCRGGF